MQLKLCSWTGLHTGQHGHNDVSYVYILGRHGYLLPVFYVVTLIFLFFLFFFVQQGCTYWALLFRNSNQFTSGFLYSLVSGADVHSLFHLGALLDTLAVVLSFPREWKGSDLLAIDQFHHLTWCNWNEELCFQISVKWLKITKNQH